MQFINNVVICVLSIAINTVSGGNILCLFGFASPSHFVWNYALIEELAKAGHNLTVLSPNIDENNIFPDNVAYILLEAVYPKLYSGDKAFDLFSFSEMTTMTKIEQIYAYKTICCEGILESNGLKTLESYPDDFKFDVVINDFTGSPCLLGFLDKFKYPPLIGVSAFNNPPFAPDLVGGQRHFYTPYYIFEYGMDMNYWQRLHNTFFHIFDFYHRNYVFLPEIDKLMRNYYKNPQLANAYDLDRKTALLLVNSNNALDAAREIPANVIEVGGLQIRDPKPLPEKLKHFVEAGNMGTILFSLGTNIRSDKLTPEVQNMFLRVFEKLPKYNFLWKFESANSDLKFPSNVMIQSWIPQNDVLAHPNTVAFITHSGLLSTQEASWYGVPVVGIPFIVDQFKNVQRTVETGVGVGLDFKTLSEQKIETALRKVLEDPSYRQKMKLRSQRFRDQKEAPTKRALWYVEYIIRNPDASEYLSTLTNRLGYMKSNLIDVYLGYLFILSVFATVLYRLLRLLVNGGAEKLKKKMNKTE